MSADILVIDDEAHVLNGLRRTFRGDMSVEIAESGEDAVALAADGGNYRAIVCDLRMRGMDGIETLHRIRTYLPASPRILLTGHADAEVLQRAINEAAVFRVIEKPCSRTMLEAAIFEALSVHTATQEQIRITEKSVLSVIRVVQRILADFDLGPGRFRPRIRSLARIVAEHTQASKSWELDAALELSTINLLKLEADKLCGRYSDVNDRFDFARGIFASIPRLQKVAEAIHFKDKNFDGTGYPANLLNGDAIPPLGRVLRLMLEYERLLESGLPEHAALADLQSRQRLFDPVMLDILAAEVEISASILPAHTDVA